MPDMPDTTRPTIGLSTAALFAKQQGVPLSTLAAKYDIEDDRSAPDTPDGLQHIASLPQYPAAHANVPGAAPRFRGDVIDQIAIRNGGRTPTAPVAPNTISAAASRATALRAPNTIERASDAVRDVLGDQLVNAGQRFSSGALGSLRGMLPYAGAAAAGPAAPAVATGLLSQNEAPRMGNALGDAQMAAQSGDYGQATRRGLQAFPLLGGISEQLESRGAAGDVAGALGDATGTAAGGMLAGGAKAASEAAVRPIAPAIQNVAAIGAKALRRSALGTDADSFKFGAQPDAAANETGISATTGHQLNKISAAKAAAIQQKADLIAAHANIPVDVESPITAATRELESHHVKAFDPATGAQTVQLPPDAQEFIASYNAKRAVLTGGQSATAPQAEALRKWVDGKIKSFDPQTSGSAQKMAQDVYHGLQRNLEGSVDGLGVANKRIQSFVTAEDAAHTKHYGQQTPDVVSKLLRKSGAFIPGTATKTAGATVLSKLAGPAATAVETKARTPIAPSPMAPAPAPQSVTSSTPAAPADIDSLVSRAGTAQATARTIPETFSGRVDRTTRALAASPASPASAPPSPPLRIPAMSEVHFGQQRQHGLVLGPAPKTKIPSVLVQTRNSGIVTVPIDQLTILQRPPVPK